MAVALSSLLYLGGCSKVEEPDNRDLAYGHVQFKLYKEASYEPQSKADGKVLDRLSDATKVKVEFYRIRHDSNHLRQPITPETELHCNVILCVL